MLCCLPQAIRRSWWGWSMRPLENMSIFWDWKIEIIYHGVEKTKRNILILLIPRAMLRPLQDKFYLGVKIKLKPFKLSLNWKVDFKILAITPPSLSGRDSNQSLLTANSREYIYDLGPTPIFQRCQGGFHAWNQNPKFWRTLPITILWLCMTDTRKCWQSYRVKPNIKM